MNERPHSSERGASLIMALAFVSLLGVFGSVLLGYAGTSQRATVAVREQRRAVYANDGAVQTAIQWARRDGSVGRDPALAGSCPDFVVPDLDAEAVTVGCTGEVGSGTVVPGVNAPTNGLLTLARGSESGLTTTGKGQLRVTGAVFSNSGLTVGAGGRVEAVDAPLTTRGACSAASVAGSPVRCAIGATADATGVDPGYPSEIKALPEYREVPACPGSGTEVKLEPGFYDDARGLTTLTSDACPATTVILAPGQYYFDFDLDPARSPVWHVNDAKARVLGGCDGGSSASPTGGAHLEFGGASRIAVDAGSFEVCAPPNAGAQQVAVFGRSSGDQPKGALAAPAPGAIENPPDTVPFPEPEAARSIGETPEMLVADVVLPVGKPSSRAALDFLKFEPLEIPPGAGALSATLLLGHSETVEPGVVVAPRPGGLVTPAAQPRDPEAPKLPTVKKTPPPVTGPGGGVIAAAPGSKTPVSGSFAITVTLQPGDASKPCVWSIPAAAKYTVDQAIVTPCLDSPEERDGLTMQFEIVSDGTVPVTEHLDGVQLVVGYTLPTLRGQDGCVVAAGGCAFLASSAGTRISLLGTAYAPRASIQVSAGGGDNVLFDRGVIVRSLRLADLPPTDVDGSIRLGAIRTVRFDAVLAGTSGLQALVRYGDSPVPGATARVVWWRSAG